MYSCLQTVSDWLLIISCLLLLHVSHTHASTPGIPSSGKQFKTFVANGDTKFNHLALDKDRGWVFIGAMNHLYQLSTDLEPVMNYKTGPVEDAFECSALKCSPNAIKKPTDNHNKALVIDQLNERLITCGSVFQGLCTVHSLQNISNVLQVVQQSVVANDANASTVAFIAPGPIKQTTPTFVLYVGTTFTGNSAYRSEIPAVASLSLENSHMLSIAEMGVTLGTRMYISSLFRDRYKINYVYGFSSGKFSYFLTTQMKSTSLNSPYISKLIRICHDDKDYYSYTEIPIECTGSDGRQYNLAQAAFIGKPGLDLAILSGITPENDMLFVVFSQSEQVDGENANKPSSHSALCIFSLTSIKDQFKLNIENCFRGIGTFGLDFITRRRNCVLTKIESINDDFCGLDVNTPLGGEIPVTAMPVFTFNTRLTAVAATSVNQFTVVFIGTHKGHIKKIVVENLDDASEYDDIVIDKKSPVNPDMLFDSTMNNLYVMTDRKLTKVKVQDCNKYKSCWNCLSAKDPFCGWCSLENKCSLWSNCTSAAINVPLWLPYNTGRCSSIAGINPKELQRTTAQTLKLIIHDLPPLTSQFLCAFTIFDKVLITNATRTYVGVNCSTPRTDLLPSIPHGQHQLTAKLSVKTSSDLELGDSNFTFFDCNTYTSCTLCVSSNFPCDWCVDTHQCIHTTTENCRNDVIITGINKGEPNCRSGPTFCPTINATIDGSREIIVAVGTKKTVRVRIHLSTFLSQTHFLCQFNIEGCITTVQAELISDVLSCDPVKFTYSKSSPNVTATFAVMWNGSKPIDNPYNIHVLIYRCRDMADNCGICLSLDQKFGCGWCQSTNSCEINDQCSNSLEDWLNSNNTCPSILSFHPHLGPWEGGTNITIEGINLSKSFKDSYGNITVAGTSCEPYEHFSKTTREIVCQVDGPRTSQYSRGPILVRVNNTLTQSETDYEFVDPIIEDIFPTNGPMSGGTLLSIKGKYINAGSLTEVYIDELPCRIIYINHSEIQCLTNASNCLQKGKVKVKFDHAIRSYNKDLYEYKEDSTIENLASGVANCIKNPKGIPAGGIKISISGTHLLSIQKPKFYLYNVKKTKRYFSDCQVYNDSLMTCPSPYIPDIQNSMLNLERPKQLHYGFVMDNISSLQNLSFSNSYPKFLLYPNPIFDKFHHTLENYRSDYLIINGMNINKVCQESDISVYVGCNRCLVTSLSKQQLICKLPFREPLHNIADNFTSPIQEVVVMIGQHFREIIGNISYSSVGAYSTTVN